ncbi:hypothetical protein YIM_22510 [Amycolatopsis sp. YIM 10]|nr:hypothetical protein YIM_22510 [Amycolatopsis sp. YIM 10]
MSPAAAAELAEVAPRCRVRALADATRGQPFRDAVVVWGRPDCDVALLLVLEGAGGPVQADWPGTFWTDLTGADPVPVTAVGFPRHDVVGKIRESRQFSGVVHPLSGVRSRHWVVTTDPLARPTTGSGWAGMSGAALFGGDRLVGVITTDAGVPGGPISELRAAPARAFAEDPVLVAWIRWAGGPGLWENRPLSAPADPARAEERTTGPRRSRKGLFGVLAHRRKGLLAPPELLAESPRPGAARDRGGLTYRATEPGDLARVYTRQQLDTATDRDTGQVRVPGQSASIEHVLTDPTTRHIVVTGEAGVGKSSLLEYVEVTAWRWWRTATRATGPADAPFGPVFPIRVAARELVGRTSIAEAVGRNALVRAEPPVPGAEVLFLADALDEVTRPEDWRHVIEIVIATAREWNTGPGMPRRVVLSARSLHDNAWRSLSGAGFTEFRLQPFTVDQLRRFVMAHQTGGGDRLAEPEVEQRAATRAAEFIAYVRGNGMLDLVRLPLLAHLAVGQYFDPGDAPRARAVRADLYARAVAEFLGRFPHSRTRHDQRLHDRIDELLTRLCAEYAHEAPGHSAVTTALRGLLGDLADTYLHDGAHITTAATTKLADPADPFGPRAVTALLEATGLLVDLHTAHPRFLHRTFAEYLAAGHLCDRYGADPAVWGDALADADTRVAALFAFDRLPADRQREIADLLTADPQRVEQAAWLLAEGMCDEQTRNRILEQLWQRPDEQDERPPVRDWHQTHSALAHLPQQQERLHDLATSPGSVPIDRVNAAAALAGHDPRGTEELRRLVADDAFPGRLRIAAAWHLAHVDHAAAVAWLARFAGDTTSRHCAVAAASLAGHDPATGTARLRALVADPRSPDVAKVEAAIGLRSHDREAGTAWLRRFGADTRLFADCRVYAADALAADADDEVRAEATQLLERIAKDESVDHGYRVEAAHRLARYEKTAGAAILHEFANGGLRGRYACDAAGLLVQHDRDAGLHACRAIADSVGQEPKLRMRAADELAHHEPAEGQTRLAALSREPAWSPAERVQAAALLSARNQDLGLPLLRAFAADLPGESRVVAARALAGVDRDEGLRALLELAGSPELERHVRVSAASSIGDFDPQLKDVLLRRLGVDINPGGWYSA